jgi:hypothetical protein
MITTLFVFAVIIAVLIICIAARVIIMVGRVTELLNQFGKFLLMVCPPQSEDGSEKHHSHKGVGPVAESLIPDEWLKKYGMRN